MECAGAQIVIAWTKIILKNSNLTNEVKSSIKNDNSSSILVFNCIRYAVCCCC